LRARRALAADFTLATGFAFAAGFAFPAYRLSATKGRFRLGESLMYLGLLACCFTAS
jgi:hypothetical protein